MLGNIRSHHLNSNRGERLKEMFRSETSKAGNLEGVRIVVCEVVSFISRTERGFTFVSGMISSDGPEFIDRNMLILSDSTDHVRRTSPKPVTSASDIFYDVLLAKYRNVTTPEEWDRLWKSVISSGISDLVMIPRWDASRGAKAEHDHAVARKIPVDYRHNDLELLAILRKHAARQT